ncbi:MAG: DUF5012 domain-containing protein [Prevotella sp.]|nr:DUF5012 domain-containing protein [Prevotella sp.]
MKKIFLYGLLFFTASLGLVSCDDSDQHTDTRVTNYISLKVNGDAVVYVDANTTYTDAGCTAELAGEDASDKVVVDNPVNTSKIGPYTVVYSATNSDGFSASATRTVYVGKPLTGAVSDGSFRKTAAGAIVNWSGFNIEVLTDGNGLYWVEDLLGGYYEQRAGYGANYSMKGFLKVNADNTVSLAGGGNVVGWGDAYDAFKDGKFNPATNTISYCVVYANMDFNVVLTLK